MTGSKHDGKVFRPSHHLHVSGCQPSRIDPIENADAIAKEVNAWLASPNAKAATPATLETARELIQKCQSVAVHARNDGKAGHSGLTMRLTPAEILELGYLWCQFRVQSAGFEKFAGIGLAKSPGLVPGGNRQYADEELQHFIDVAKKLFPDAKKTKLITKAASLENAPSQRTFWNREEVLIF